MALSEGDRVGPYTVIGPLGAGGMGEVYRATDQRLGRSVALKLLPASLASDPERLARFEREAKVLASLSHANIATLYGLEQASGQSVLVMELVGGEDLAERLKRGPIPPEEALPVARQIAEALEEAHEKGIVHRDLKPANVKLALDGKVKVLDFGLAKAWSAEGDPLSGSAPDVSQSPTLARTGTAAGLVLGTAAYMSPEQARGKAVDKRADVWAFGAVLFEMLRGRKLFDGETVTDVLAAVVKDPIDWTTLPPSTPAFARRLLERCLERDPKRRLRDIGEARLALEAGASADPTAAAGAPRASAGLAAAALAATAAVAFGLGWSLHRPERAPLRKLDVAAVGLSSDVSQRPMLSPDGRRVAFFSDRRIHVRDLDRAEARVLPGTEGSRDLFWSPDGREIGFYREETLHRLALDAPAPLAVARTGIFVGGAGACWTRDGRIVYSRGNTPLFEVRADGGEPRVLLELDASAGDAHFHGCSVLPGDRGILFTVHPKDGPANTIALLVSGKRRTLVSYPGETLGEAAWSPSGHVVFGRTGGRNTGVWALPFSLERLEPKGEAFLVVAGAAPSLGEDGSLLYAPGRASVAQRLVWVSREGKPLGTAAELPNEITGVALSKDGKKIAATVVEGGLRHVWVIDVERGTRTRLTPDLGWAGRATFSFDGTQVAFAVNNKSYVVPADASAAPREVGAGLQPTWSADGRSLLVHLANEAHFTISRLDVSGGQPPQLLLRDSASVRFPEVSPDGRFMSYLSGDGEATTGEMMLTRFPEVDRRWQISTHGGDFGMWAPDGGRFYYVARSEKGDALARQLLEVDVRTTPEVVLGAPRPLFDLHAAGATNIYAVAPGGARFLIIEEHSGPTLGRLVLVQNWFEEFRARR